MNSIYQRKQPDQAERAPSASFLALYDLAQARISQNLIENLPARAARKNFREICL
jgi:hypothetical protein